MQLGHRPHVTHCRRGLCIPLLGTLLIHEEAPWWEKARWAWEGVARGWMGTLLADTVVPSVRAGVGMQEWMPAQFAVYMETFPGRELHTPISGLPSSFDHRSEASRGRDLAYS